LGAAVSRQSLELESREVLEEMVREYAAGHEGEIPRPERWKGYVLWPERMEFWINGENRLHDRFLFIKEDGGWVKSRLFP
jgi:pyridoxamine 5'-phosphate oxidase